MASDLLISKIGGGDYGQIPSYNSLRYVQYWTGKEGTNERHLVLVLLSSMFLGIAGAWGQLEK
jgi:hypothetical protein